MNSVMAQEARVKSPSTPAPELWAHQADALEFIEHRHGAMLHMGMGTGKSRVVVEYCERRIFGRVLILCPKSVTSVWPGEFIKHGRMDSRRVLVLDKGTGAQKAEALACAIRATGDVGQLVVVLNYEAAWREPLNKALVRARFGLFVMDESHRVKSPSGKASRFCSKLADIVPRRLALTGTPMPHSPLDVYAQMRAVDKRAFGTSYTVFKGTYAVCNPNIPGAILRYQNLDQLKQRLAIHTFQADRSVLSLPDAVHTERRCNLEPHARRVYEELKNEAIAELESGAITAANAAVRLLRLRQVTGGTVTNEHGIPTVVGTEKADLLADILEDVARDEPIVVFASFRAELDAIRAAGLAQGRKVGELSGRARDLAAFQAGEVDLLAVQIQAGGVGVDLTRAALCIYFSVGFSLGDYEQSLARVHRPGQKRSVAYIHLIAARTVDEVVYRALRARRDLVGAVLADLAGVREAVEAS